MKMKYENENEIHENDIEAMVAFAKLIYQLSGAPVQGFSWGSQRRALGGESSPGGRVALRCIALVGMVLRAVDPRLPDGLDA